MEMTRISVPVTVYEREALRVLAKHELRDPREQMRYLLQRELQRTGILPGEKKTTSAMVETAVAGGERIP